MKRKHAAGCVLGGVSDGEEMKDDGNTTLASRPGPEAGTRQDSECFYSVEELLELEEIEVQKQRHLRSVPANALKTGLALSGGGIRSATVGLGVLQWLGSAFLQAGERPSNHPGGGPPASSEESSKEREPKALLNRVDYLSTVSGGGYIGSWLVANQLRKEEAPASHHFLASKSNQVAHLRGYSRYLSPQKGIMSADFWTMLAAWFRNTFLINLMVLALVTVVMVIIRIWPVLVYAVGHERENSGCICLLYWGAFVVLLGIAALGCRREFIVYREDDARTDDGEKKLEPSAQNPILVSVVLPVFGSAIALVLGLWQRAHLKNMGKQSACMRNQFDPSSNAVGDDLTVVVSVLVGLMAAYLVIAPKPRESRGFGSWLMAARVWLGVVLSNLVLIYWVSALINQLKAWKDDVAIERDADAFFGADWAPALVAVLGPAVVCACFGLIVIVGLGLAGREMDDKIREWWSRLGAWLGIVCLGFAGVAGLVVLGPALLDWLLPKTWAWASKTGLAVTWLGALAAAVFFGQKGGKDGTRAKQSGLSIRLSALTFAAFLGLILGGAVLVRFMLTPETPDCGHARLLVSDCVLSLPRWLSVFGLAVFVGAFLAWTVDINEFSMNHFYRNRLVRCYLGATKIGRGRRRHPFTGFDFKDDLLLSELCHRGENARPYPGPYPLINTALNTASNGDLDVQERMAESFLLSPVACGSHRESMPGDDGQPANKIEKGYCDTRIYMTGKHGGRGLKLGTAVSISGAAASPNAGYHTSPVMAFLLTLFNARLGWWVPNPALAKHHRYVAPTFPGFLRCLFNELFGTASSRSDFVHLSDGGHFENLGIYELVRRRCGLIIAVDAEQDGAYRFHGLGTVIRRCQVDFGAKIEINVDDLRPDPVTGWSRYHGAVGTISYPNGGTGVLLYLKVSMSGDESTDIMQFKAMAPAFPHQSTGDQWFSESQFESYRRLGEHMIESMLRPFLQKANGSDSVEALCEWLREYWFRPASAPAGVFTQHAKALDVLWQEVSRSDAPSVLAEILLPNWKEVVAGHWNAHARLDEPAAVRAVDALKNPAVFAFCQRLFQIMENVYLDLHLRTEAGHKDNLGWMVLFKQWSGHPVVKFAWECSKETFGQRFRGFWEELQDWQPPSQP